MYGGAYGVSIGQVGYDNGSLWAFFIYSLVAILFFFLLKKKELEPLVSSVVLPMRFQRYCFRALFLMLLLVGIMLFGFDAHRVWSGEVGKGEFRASLGSFGFFAYLTTKFIAPLSLAYAAFLYRLSARRFTEKSILATLLVMGFVLGATWGFKATGITIVLPAMLILLWSSGFLAIAAFSICSLVIILVFAFIFDDSESLVSAISFIFVRLTVIQGDVAWYVWGKYQAGMEMPSYAPTLAAALSDTFLQNVLGVDKDNYREWISFHYDLLLNDVAGVPMSAAEGGHSIVGTPFSEGIIMGGPIGIFIMAILSGLLSALVYNRINKSLALGNGMASAIWATYFCVFLFPWLRGGALVQLFHVSLIVSFLISAIFVFFMRKLVFLQVKK